MNNSIHSDSSGSSDSSSFWSSSSSDSTSEDDHSHKLSLPQFQSLFTRLSSRHAAKLMSNGARHRKKFIHSAADPTCDIIALSMTMLNELNRIYEKHNRVAMTERLMFANHTHSELVHHPRSETVSEPQLVVVPSRIFESWKRSPSSSISWHHVIAAVHTDPRRGDVHPANSCEVMLGSLNQARPDLPGCFAITTTRFSCRFWWSDPSGPYASVSSPWSDDKTLELIFDVLHRMHHPLSVDSTIKLEPKSCLGTTSVQEHENLHSDRPVWHVQGPDHVVWRVTDVLNVGNPWSRQSWIAATREQRAVGEPDFTPHPRMVIKDSWLLREGAILGHIHSGNSFPGVCRLDSTFIVRGPDGELSTLSIAAANEFDFPVLHKRRIILDGSAANLYSCPSVLDFLMVMYDTLEVLKTLHEKRGILHRDVSIRNILRAPPNVIRHPTSKSTFIGDILRPKYSNMRSGPSCTLIDFDNAFWIGHTPEASLKAVVGSPTYAARLIAQRFCYFDYRPPSPMPVLSGAARRCYELAHGSDHYEAACRMHDYDAFTIEGSLGPDRAHYSPRHDAESCFWVIVHFLLTALPAGADPGDDETRDAERLREALETHRFGTVFDSRELTFSIRNASWRCFLHPDLRAFSSLLESLVMFVQPVYEFSEPEIPEHHLHEAMQRVLLQEICRVLDENADVVLNVSSRRALHTLYDTLPGFTDIDQTPSIQNKRKRVGDEHKTVRRCRQRLV